MKPVTYNGVAWRTSQGRKANFLSKWAVGLISAVLVLWGLKSTSGWHSVCVIAAWVILIMNVEPSAKKTQSDGNWVVKKCSRDEVPEDVRILRERVESDILVCLAPFNYEFSWWGNESVTQILVWKTGRVHEASSAKLNYTEDFSRVESVDYLENGVWYKARNIAYLSRLYAESKSQSAATAPCETTNATVEPPVSTVTAQKPVQEPTQTATPSSDAQQETNEPQNTTGVPDGVLSMSSSLVWDEICGPISDLLSAALEDKQTELRFKWPVGIQSAYEAEQLAKLIREALSLEVTVDDEAHNITIHIPQEAEPHAEETVTNEPISDASDASVVESTSEEPVTMEGDEAPFVESEEDTPIPNQEALLEEYDVPLSYDKMVAPPAEDDCEFYIPEPEEN